MLANVPAQTRSTLTSVYIVVLCTADDAKMYGYGTVLEPLLKYLKSLAGLICIASLVKSIKGTVSDVVANNL